MFAVDLDRRISDARNAARNGDWPRVQSMLDNVRGIEQHVEGAILLAESLLRTARARRARALLERILPLMDAIGDRTGRLNCLNMLGAACKELGDITQAEHAWRRVLDLAHVDDDALVIARATNNLGIVANIRGDHRRALAFYQLAVPMYQHLGRAEGLAESYHNMAVSHRDRADYDRADEYEQRALDYAVSAANPWLAAAARFGRADITLRRGDAELAAPLAERVAQEWEALGDPVSAGHALRLRGSALLLVGHVHEASAAIERALVIAVESANTLLEAESRRARAELRIAMNNSSGARDDISRAVALYDQLGARSDSEEATRWAADRGLVVGS